MKYTVLENAAQDILKELKCAHHDQVFPYARTRVLLLRVYERLGEVLGITEDTNGAEDVPD